jgi:hypothetical protein
MILALGKWVPAFLAPLAPQLELWLQIRSLVSIDAVGPVVDGVEFPDTGSRSCTVVALTHPSMRGLNIDRRGYRGVTGHAAELSMLHDAVTSSGLRRGADR